MESISRRSFFRLAGGALVTVPVLAPAQEHHQPRQPSTTAKPSAAALFFRPDEMRWIEAATERLIPQDDNGPGAQAAGVPAYIDRQLAGAWGAGERLYRSGPWHAGQPTQGYQLPFTPAELFRNALRGVREQVQTQHQAAFETLTGAQQDAYLEALQHSDDDLHGVPGHMFFESLLGLSIEGFFSDPVYGGNRDMAAWKMIGFPGAYASFYDLVDRHGMAYTRAPISMGDNGAGVIHLHPVSKARGAKRGG